MKTNMNCKLVMSVVLVLAMAASASAVTVWSLDFAYSTDTVAPGYTRVDHGNDPGAAKVYNAVDGFGWLDGSQPKARTSSSGDPRLDSGVYMKGDTFQIDVDNGNYLMELAGGVLYATYAKYEISGDGGTTWTLVGRDASLAGTSGNPMPYTYQFDGLAATWPRVGSVAPEVFNVPANQFLQGKDVPINVSAGKILIKGYQDGSGGTALSFVDVALVPEPATLSLLGLGSLLIARRKRRS